MYKYTSINNRFIDIQIYVQRYKSERERKIPGKITLQWLESRPAGSVLTCIAEE